MWSVAKTCSSPPCPPKAETAPIFAELIPAASQRVLDVDPRLFVVLRESSVAADRMLCVHNVTDQLVSCSLNEPRVKIGALELRPYQSRWLKLVEFLRKAEPNAVFHLHRTTKEPVVFLWYEVFESQAALDNHLKVVVPAFQKEFGPTPEGILARPSESETYRKISK